MAITEEEKRMAIALYDKYSDVFDSIYDALLSTGTIEYSTSELTHPKTRASGRIAVKIGGKVFSDTMVRTLIPADFGLPRRQEVYFTLAVAVGKHQQAVYSVECAGSYPSQWETVFRS